MVFLGQGWAAKLSERDRGDWPDRLQVLVEKAQVRAKETTGWGLKMGPMYLGPQHGPGHFLQVENSGLLQISRTSTGTS